MIQNLKHSLEIKVWYPNSLQYWSCSLHDASRAPLSYPWRESPNARAKSPPFVLQFSLSHSTADLCQSNGKIPQFTSFNCFCFISSFLIVLNAEFASLYLQLVFEHHLVFREIWASPRGANWNAVVFALGSCTSCLAPPKATVTYNELNLNVLNCFFKFYFLDFSAVITCYPRFWVFSMKHYGLKYGWIFFIWANFLLFAFIKKIIKACFSS